MTPSPAPGARRTAAALVHLFTAAGAACGLFALLAAVEHEFRTAFAWLAAQVAIDACDGFLARVVDVRSALPRIDGARLDDVVDYVTYVFVPAAIVVIGGVVPGAAGWAIASGMLVASALGFARADAKTDDHFFTGFPSYWNIVVLYTVAFALGPVASAIVLATGIGLVFVPVRYVYPSRTRELRSLTLVLAAIWGALVLVMIAQLPDVAPIVRYGALVFPVYYVVLSLVLDRARRSRRPRERAA